MASKEKRLPPHNLEAEENLLSAFLVEPEAIYDVPRLEPEHFYGTKNGLVYQIMCEQLKNGITPDFVTVGDRLPDDDVSWLAGIAGLVASPIMVPEYAGVVVDKARRRSIIRTAGALAKAAWDESIPVDQVLAISNDMMVNELVVDGQDDVFTAYQMAQVLLNDVNRMIAMGGGIRGIETGFEQIDKRIMGLKDGDLHIVAARPGMGKTSLLTQWMHNIAKQGLRVLLFTLEMSAEQVSYRVVSQLAEIPYNDIYSGNMEENGVHHQKFLRAVGEYSELPVVVDQSNNSASQMFTKTQRQIAIGGPVDIVMVDYLQLMDPEKGSSGNRTQDVSNMSRGLKFLAKRLNLPVVAVAQLSRKVEDRQDRRPQLSDLRDSGEIEQDASVVMFIYRDDYYNGLESDFPGKAELNISKNRYGEPGIVDLTWEPKFTRFLPHWSVDL